jgi:hypothetical protein
VVGGGGGGGGGWHPQSLLDWCRRVYPYDFLGQILKNLIYSSWKVGRKIAWGKKRLLYLYSIRYMWACMKTSKRDWKRVNYNCTTWCISCYNSGNYSSTFARRAQLRPRPFCPFHWTHVIIVYIIHSSYVLDKTWAADLYLIYKLEPKARVCISDTDRSDANVLSYLKNDPSYEFIGEVVLKLINIV